MNSIPTRSRQAIRDLIDLTDYYNASLNEDWLGQPGVSLAAMPRSVQAFAAAVFDVRGIVQLGGGELAQDRPQAVTGIPINYQGDKLHFLQGAAGHAEDDTKIGEYVLHYADGQTRLIPIVYQRQAVDCCPQAGDAVPTDADIAWTGEDAQGNPLRVCQYTANNPLPEVEIESLDIVSTMTTSAPFLLALTVQPHEPFYESFSAARIDVFCPIAPRDPQTSLDLVDLSAHYTSSMDDNWFCHAGHDLRDVPRGVQELGGVAWDIRGLVQLAACKTVEITGVVFPEAVEGIAVGRKGQRLHFLQACFWNTQPGTKIGEYVVHYADGQTRAAPIIYGENVVDWWVRPDGVHLSGAETVWQGSNPATASMGLTTHLIKYSWDNPLPEVEISSVDFVSCLEEASPFLVAMTVEA